MSIFFLIGDVMNSIYSLFKKNYEIDFLCYQTYEIELNLS